MRKPRTLAVMVKAPVCGAVKTRLARQIGAVQALALYRCLTAQVLRTLSGDPRWSLVLAVSPDGMKHARFQSWSRARTRVGQGRGGLGERMQQLFDRAGEGPLIIAGSDIPFVTRDAIAHAFRLLDGHDAVFGPAEDGGYWLAGLRRRPKIIRPFNRVRWSTANALRDTVQNLEHRSVAFAATFHDIDGAEDYRRYRKSPGYPVVN